MRLTSNRHLLVAVHVNRCLLANDWPANSLLNGQAPLRDRMAVANRRPIAQWLGRLCPDVCSLQARASLRPV